MFTGIVQDSGKLERRETRDGDVRLVIGSARLAGCPPFRPTGRRVRARVGMAACSTVPHAWQPPHRPDHFLVRQPHSAH